MNCKDVNELLNEYIDNELSPGQTAEVKAHLDGCDACKKEMEELAGLHNNLRDVLKRLPVMSLLCKFIGSYQTTCRYRSCSC